MGRDWDGTENDGKENDTEVVGRVGGVYVGRDTVGRVGSVGEVLDCGFVLVVSEHSSDDEDQDEEDDVEESGGTAGEYC